MSRGTITLLAFLSLIMTLTLLGCTRSAVGKAENTAKSKATSRPAFDEKRAFELLEKQVQIGPRYPGSPGHATTVEFIQSEMKPYASKVRAQDFTKQVNGKTLHMKNILAFINPDAKDWVILAAHWDTRPIADMEVTTKKQSQPILGANDGASGVAVLMELARVFHEQKPDVGVMMVFFDGEDYGEMPESMLMGSSYFAEHLDDSLQLDGKKLNVKYGILLDMIGDKNLVIYQEQNSVTYAGDVVQNVWSVADDLGYSEVFIPSVKYSIIDDHIPLNKAGIKFIDIIDFDYAPWHTLDDTVDKCSSRSLGIVGEVVAETVYRENAR